MPAERSSYAARQAELLRALMRGHGYPDGFSVPRADAAGLALRRKRARAVRERWPALAASLGERFDERFDGFARLTGPPAWGHGLTDGLAFAEGLRHDELSDGARVELLFARAVVRRDARGAWRLRRGVFAAAAALQAPRRLLFVVRLPRVGGRIVVVARGRRARLGG